MFENSGIDVNKKDEVEKTTLHSAAANNNLVQVEQLLSQRADVNSRDDMDRTPLHCAAYNNLNESHFKVAETLLKNRADVNPKDNEGRTPLHHSVNKSSLKFVQLFLNFGADLHVVDGNGENLLFSAVCYGLDENVQVVKLLVDQGLDVNHRNKMEQTPLHVVAMYNVEEKLLSIAEILLKKGADVNARDRDGRTPFWFLVNSGNLKIIEMFLNSGADVNVVDNKGQIVLSSAIHFNKSFENLQLLINLGLGVNYRDNAGKTPLHWEFMFEAKNFKIMKCLLKNGANATAVDERGFTPLIVAVREYSLKNLLKANWKRTVKNFNFIMENNDFTVVHKSITALTVNYRSFQNHLRKKVIEHIAKLQTLNIPVHPHFLSEISEVREYDKYYKKCEEELLRAKVTKLPNSWLTFYNLLLDDRRKIKNYAGNRDLTGDFKKIGVTKKFPIYGDFINENLKNGIKRRELFDKASCSLSNCLPIFNPNHLVIRDVLDYVLSKKDLSKLC